MGQRVSVALAVGCLLLSSGCEPRSSSEPGGTTEQLPDPQGAAPPLYDDISAASGINFSYRNGEDTANHMSILESLGGGAGRIVFDGDVLLDIYLPGWG